MAQTPDEKTYVEIPLIEQLKAGSILRVILMCRISPNGRVSTPNFFWRWLSNMERKWKSRRRCCHLVGQQYCAYIICAYNTLFQPAQAKANRLLNLL